MHYMIHILKNILFGFSQIPDLSGFSDSNLQRMICSGYCKTRLFKNLLKIVKYPYAGKFNEASGFFLKFGFLISFV